MFRWRLSQFSLWFGALQGTFTRQFSVDCFTKQVHQVEQGIQERFI